MSPKEAFVRHLPKQESSGPAGARRPSAAAPQARFIPREELGHFSSWRPGDIEGHTAPGAHYLPPTPLQRATAQALAAASASAARAVAPAGSAAATAAAAADAAAAARLTGLAAADPSVSLAAARQAGYQDGYRDGMAALENFKQSYATQVTAQVGTLLEAFDTQLLALDGAIAQALAQAATQLARELLRSELQTRPELVAQVATEAVAALLPSARQISVFAHPQDLPLIHSGAAEALAARSARVVADANVARGGVRVESDIGSVDAGIATRWRQAAASLGSALPWDDGVAAPAGGSPSPASSQASAAGAEPSASAIAA
jgi:flagellar assembly protein FliH